MQQMVQALKREVRMLRTECAYLRNQVCSTGRQEAGGRGTGHVGSRVSFIPTTLARSTVDGIRLARRRPW